MKKRARLVKSIWNGNSGINVIHKTEVSLCSVHGHDFYELDMILGGTAPTTLNGCSHTAQAGTVFFLTPEDFHDYPAEQPLELYNIQFREDAVSGTVLRRLTEQRGRLYQPQKEKFSLLCSFTQAMVQEEDPALRSRLLECILLLLCQSLKEEQAPARPGGDLQKAVLYIHAHFRENPPLGEVAGLLPLNEKYFCKRFLEYTGKTYKEYLRELKLRYARRMILLTDRPILEIALESGYATQSHFNREFRQYYGLAPLELKSQIKK